MKTGKAHRLILLPLVLLLALALRLYGLETQSLWNDEGTSVALAGRDLITITRNAAHDIHPPLYYYLLHFWVVPFGTTEFALRSLSAFTGTLLVALTFALGQRLFSADVGLVAALLSAISPFQVYYSQETRMYILVTLLGALSVYLGWRMVDGGWRMADGEVPSSVHVLSRITYHTDRVGAVSRSSFLISHSFLILYVIVTVAALYTHYFAFSVVLAENLIFVAWLVTRRRWQQSELVRWVRTWIVGQGVVGLLYLPWLTYSWRQLRQWPAVSEPFSLGFLLRDVWRVFSLGLPGEAANALPLVVSGLALLLGCTLPTLCSRRTLVRRLQHLSSHVLDRGRRWTLVQQEQVKGRRSRKPVSAPVFPLIVTLLYLLVPVAATYLLSLRRAMYNPKFLLLATPPFYLLLARGVVVPFRVETRFLRRNRVSVAVGPVVSGLLLLSLLILSARSLHATYFDSHYYRDDYRGIVRTITAVADENDAVVINAPGQFETFAYYYQGSLDVYPLPRQRPMDVTATRQDLEAIAAGHDRIFAVLWATDESDPGRFVESWLDEHAFKARDTWYGNVRLVIYALPPEGVSAGAQHPLRVNLGDQVTLLGYSLAHKEVEAGEVLPLTLIWQARARITERYKVFVHLLDQQGHIVGQRDAEPGGGARLTTTWQPGEVVTDNYGVLVAPGTPPGPHRLIVGMYSLISGARLPVMDGSEAGADYVGLTTVQVTRPLAPPSADALGMMHRSTAEFGEVTLLGYDLSRLGSEHQPDVPLHPGDVAHVTLYWQAGPAPAQDIGLSLLLLGRDDRVWAGRQTGPVDGNYPVSLWEPGEIVRDQHLLFLPPDLPPGRYRLRLEVRALDGRMLGTPLHLGPVTVQ